MFDQFLDFMFSRWFWIPTIFFFGIFLIYLGKRRLRFEAQPDPRYDMIPDEDVKKFWRWMTQFDIFRSKFYIYFFGPLMIAFAVINGIMLFIVNKQVPDDLMSIEQIGYFGYLIIISFCVSESVSLGGGAHGCGSNVGYNKSFIIDIYKCIHFHSKKELGWIEKNLKPPIGSSKKFYKREIGVLKRINYIPCCWVIGRGLWFITWTVFFVYFTILLYLCNS